MARVFFRAREQKRALEAASGSWESSSSAARKAWASEGDLAKAALLWRQAIRLWDGSGDRFPAELSEVPAAFASGCMDGISADTVYPARVLPSIDAEMELRHPECPVRVSAAAFTALSVKLPRCVTCDRIAMLCMNIFSLEAGRAAWAADIREVPGICAEAQRFASEAADECAKAASSGNHGKLDPDVAARGIDLYSQFFGELGDTAAKAVSSKTQKEIDRAVAHWKAHLRDRSDTLALGLNIIEKASTSSAPKNFAAADYQIEKFVGGYFVLRP